MIWASSPILHDAAVKAEVTLRTMWTPQAWGDGPVRWVWQPMSLEPKYGAWPLVVGSLKVTFIALMVSTPISVAAAIYTAHLSPRRVREVLKPAIELLAGVPSDRK